MNYGLHREVTRSQNALKKEELVEAFNRKFSIEILQKAFHASRASFLREHKKYQKVGKLPNKDWKLYESMLFLKYKPKTNKVACTSEEHETLTTFYQTNPALWNHGMIEYGDRNIRGALIQKLCDEIDEKFTEDDTRNEWNVLLTRYRREKQAEKVTRSSGLEIDGVFNSNCEHFQQMTFLETTPELIRP